MIFWLCIIIGLVIAHIAVQLLDEEKVWAKEWKHDDEEDRLDVIQNELKGKLIIGVIVGLVIYVCVCGISYFGEDSNTYIKKVLVTHNINKIDGELAITISGCNNCSDIRIKFVDTNGGLQNTNIKRANIKFDGGNKMVTYSRTRQPGFRKWFFGAETSDIKYLHLDKELSKKF